MLVKSSKKCCGIKNGSNQPGGVRRSHLIKFLGRVNTYSETKTQVDSQEVFDEYKKTNPNDVDSKNYNDLRIQSFRNDEIDNYKIGRHTYSNDDITNNEPILKYETYANIKTKNGIHYVIGYNTSPEKITDVFNVLYFDYKGLEVGSNNTLIEYKGIKYDIVDIENQNEDSRVLLFYCIKKGISNLNLND